MGSLVGLEGRIETGSYQAQDGTTRYTTDIVADSVQFLESKKDTPSRSGETADPEKGYYADQDLTTGSGQAVADQYSDYQKKISNSNMIFNDDELPF